MQWMIDIALIYKQHDYYDIIIKVRVFMIVLVSFSN